MIIIVVCVHSRREKTSVSVGYIISTVWQSKLSTIAISASKLGYHQQWTLIFWFTLGYRRRKLYRNVHV